MKKLIIIVKLWAFFYVSSVFANQLSIPPNQTLSMSELSGFSSVEFFGKGVLNISQTSLGTFTYAGLISSGSSARGREIEINAPGATIQLTELTGIGSVPISGPITIYAGTLQGNTSPSAVLNLAASGAVYNLGEINQTIGGLQGVQGSTVNLVGSNNTLSWSKW